MTDFLQALVDRARKITMNPSELREHRRSFVYGNTYIENEQITREMVDEADSKSEEQKKQK
jgi:hypothetical protein